MSYLVIARKWRPQRFEDVVGQDHVTQTLQNAILQNKIHHAFLFTGTRGVGKTTCARLLAKALCCEAQDGPTPTPCNQCASCKAISEGQSVDIQEIDGASNTGVDNIRDLKENAQYRPQNARYKIYIIDEVHMLSTSAFNALLKILEEPPEHVKFIFATTEVHKIPQTILSRTQRYDFKMVPTGQVVNHLQRILDQEGIGYTETAIRTIGRLARGSMRDSQSLLDRVLAFAGDSISDQDVQTVLGVTDRAALAGIVNALVDRDGTALFDRLNELCSLGLDLRQFGEEMLEFLRNTVLALSHREPQKVLDLPDSEVQELVALAKREQEAVWLQWFDLMFAGQERLARAEQGRLSLEMTLAAMLQVKPVVPIDTLLQRLGALSKKLSGTGPRPMASPAQQSGSYQTGYAPDKKKTELDPGAQAFHTDFHQQPASFPDRFPPDEDQPPPRMDEPADFMPEASSTFQPESAPTPMAPPSPQAPKPHTETREQAPVAIPQQTTQAGGNPTPKAMPSWEDFCKRFEKNKMVWLQLVQAEVGDWTVDKAEILCPPSVFTALNSPTNLESLKRELTGCCGNPVALTLKKSESQTRHSLLEQNRQSRQQAAKDLRKEWEQDPLVMEIRKVFGGGKVRGVPRLGK